MMLPLWDQGSCSPVSDDHFLKIAPHGQLNAVLQVGVVHLPPRQQLGGQLIKAADGPLDHLGEEGDKEEQLGEIFLRLVFVPIHIDDVAYRLEHEKGDTQGQNQFRQGDLAAGREGIRQRLQQVGGEVPVLEHIQQNKIRQAGNQHHSPAIWFVFGGDRLFLLFGGRSA